MPNSFSKLIPLQAALRRWVRRSTPLLGLVVGLALALDRSAQEEVLKFARAHYGGQAAERVSSWFALMLAAGQAGEKEKLKLVNEYFNRIPNISDEAHWASADYWATPLELIVTYGGDCEDFTLAKYFTLRELGVPDERKKIISVMCRPCVIWRMRLSARLLLRGLKPNSNAPWPAVSGSTLYKAS